MPVSRKAFSAHAARFERRAERLLGPRKRISTPAGDLGLALARLAVEASKQAHATEPSGATLPATWSTTETTKKTGQGVG
jgi:hypothetical protein